MTIDYTFKYWHATLTLAVILAYVGSYLASITHWGAPATLFFSGLCLVISPFLIMEKL